MGKVECKQFQNAPLCGLCSMMEGKCVKKVSQARQACSLNIQRQNMAQSLEAHFATTT